MKRLAPRVVRGRAMLLHPALLAWHRLHAADGAVSLLEVWRETSGHQPASVYRLEVLNGRAYSIFAKRCDAASCDVERTCHEEIVPRLGLSTPDFYGSIGEPDGTRWFFHEDVGQHRFSALDPTHRALASRWLGRLHRVGAEIEAARALPDAGTARYLAHLHGARDRIRRNFANPAFRAEERDLLASVLSALDRAEALWGVIERACAELPRTLVHGDFRPKNVRIREEASGPVLYALDWELAGWGTPVTDLAPARGDARLQVDPQAYAAEVQGQGRELDEAAVLRLGTIGFLLRRLAAIEWDAMSLHYPGRACLIGPLTSLKVLLDGLLPALEIAEASA